MMPTLLTRPTTMIMMMMTIMALRKEKILFSASRPLNSDYNNPIRTMKIKRIIKTMIETIMMNVLLMKDKNKLIMAEKWPLTSGSNVFIFSFHYLKLLSSH